MPEQLYVAANLAQSSLVFGHLQIVYEDADGALFETESTSSGFPYFWGDWVYPAFGARHDDTSNTPGYGDAQDYAIVGLDLRPGQVAGYVWELLGQVHQSLSTGGFGIDYDIDQNSNSYVASLLSVVGIDIADYLGEVTPPSVISFPGVETNILFGAKTGGLFSGDDTPIPLTLAGTAGDDFIRTGIGDDRLGGAEGNDRIEAGAGDDHLRGGSGKDTLRGDDGADRIWGQTGRDTINGGAGDDAIYGNAGNDALHGASGDDHLIGGFGNDVLRGGQGQDVLDGSWGDDKLVGQQGADTFRFAFGRDVVADFEDDLDVIAISAELAGDAMTGQQIVDLYGRIDDGDAVLDFGQHELRIQDVSDLSVLADDVILY